MTISPHSTQKNMYNRRQFFFDYHFENFMKYNFRLVNKDWRNASEEKIIRDQERFHAEQAAELLPASILFEAGAVITNDFPPPQH